jgi:hypothetical protein
VLDKEVTQESPQPFVPAGFPAVANEQLEIILGQHKVVLLEAKAEDFKVLVLYYQWEDNV